MFPHDSVAAAARERLARAQMQRLATEAARRDREVTWLRMQDDGVRLGSLSVMRAGPIGRNPPLEPLLAVSDLLLCICASSGSGSGKWANHRQGRFVGCRSEGGLGGWQGLCGFGCSAGGYLRVKGSHRDCAQGWLKLPEASLSRNGLLVYDFPCICQKQLLEIGGEASS
jgi:hypothetical protein